MITSVFKLTSIYFLLVFVNIYFSKKFKLFDTPSSRKIHNINIVNTGGLPIFIFYLIIVSKFELNKQIEEIIVFSFFVLLIGFLDDIIKLSPFRKLILLIMPVIYLINDGLIIDNLGNYDYLGYIFLGKFSFIFTLLCVGLLINSINYSDGIDGLALILNISALFYFILLTENYNTKILLSLLLIPLFINLFFNFLPTKSGLKLFIGDSGSLLLGFILSFVMIYLHIFENIAPSLIMWSVWLPVFDFLYVTFRRLYLHRSPFVPDNTHFHHKMYLIFKKNAFLATLSISLINIITISIGYTIYMKLGSFFSIIFVVSFLIFISIRSLKN